MLHISDVNIIIVLNKILIKKSHEEYYNISIIKKKCFILSQIKRIFIKKIFLRFQTRSWLKRTFITTGKSIPSVTISKKKELT